MLRLTCCVALTAILLKLSSIPWYLYFGVVTLLYLSTGGWKWLRLLSKTIKRDTRYIKHVIIVIYKAYKLIKKKAILSDVFLELVKKHPDKLAFVSADTRKSLTFKQVEQLSHKIGNIFYEAGYRKGDVVALLMENRVEYIPIYLGLSMIGIVTSMINYNLRQGSLKHCLDICKCKGIIFSEEMAESLREIETDLQADLYCYENCERFRSDIKSLENLMESAISLPPPRPDKLTVSDPMLYQYTSGTTGLPKAAIVKAKKYLFGLIGFNTLCDIRESDILYQALPLYHGNGCLFASNTIIHGTTTIIKKRFSATRYMEECCKHNVTFINYIGETCRYLLSQPRSVYDDTNSIRVAIGNGLRASMWTEFKERFKIDQIAEFYAATEGNTGLLNNVGKVGAVGFSPLIFPNSHLALIKVDKNTGEIMRNSNGLALKAKTGEPGQFVGKIIKKYMEFDGYLNKAASEKKIAHDIIKKGDSAFLSGDILIKDEEGFYYFQDRIGDTFRWKGENVSTNEVEGLISKALELTDVCVYGVEVPGTEGKAGMACICDPDKKVNVENLLQALELSLPKYAQPVFLRMSSTIAVTGTFKLEKSKLRDEGFNPHHTSSNQDDLYYFNNKEGMYVTIDNDVYQQILSQNIRF